MLQEFGQQYIASDDVERFQRVDCMNSVVVIPSGKKGCRWISQAIHDGVQFRIRPAFNVSDAKPVADLGQMYAEDRMRRRHGWRSLPGGETSTPNIT